MLYFAYGSNLDEAQLRRHCPRAAFQGVAYLVDHRLAFPLGSEERKGGSVGAVPAKGAKVWGGLFEVDAAGLAALDAQEGITPGSSPPVQRRRLEVRRADGPSTPCELYLPTPTGVHVVPDAAYVEKIAAGMARWNLPGEAVIGLRLAARMR